VADKGLPDPILFPPPAAGGSEEQVSGPVSERRAFLRRTAMVGLPVLLASVRARTAWAQEPNGPSCAESLGASGCFERNKP